jgi:2-aminoadipate transaminase
MGSPLARRMSRIKASTIREMLKVTERPDVLSFAGGLPAPEAFPVAELRRAHDLVLTHDAEGALQYGPTEGYAPLRAWIAGRLALQQQKVAVEQVLVTAGAQQGIDLTIKALCDPGDLVIVERPSYLAFLQACDSYEVRVATVASDEDGMDVDDLERLVRRELPKIVYLVPTYSNPRGVTLSLPRRQKLARLSAEHGFYVMEDEPYCDLRFSGERRPTLAALEPRANVVYLGTFSKTLAPGMRLGYAVSDAAMARTLTVAKQAVDLHTSSLSQRAAMKLLESFDFDAHLGRIQALYRERRDALVAAIAEHFPKGSTWTRADGGLFVWARLPGGIDTEKLLPEAVEARVAFVPGTPFYASEPDRSTMRLNFSNRPPELIAEGIARIGACAARWLARG